jgi:hypothetical protein
VGSSSTSAVCFPDAFLVTVDMPASGDATGLSLAACQVRNKILEKEFGNRIRMHPR